GKGESELWSTWEVVWVEKPWEMAGNGFEVGFVCTMAEIGCSRARIGPSKSSQSS
ncbi:hypothetical protein Tco_0555097, partial [Tanacetum coccineum]